MCSNMHCRFNASSKFVNPSDPEQVVATDVPNAPQFWAWVDTSIATTQRMLQIKRWVAPRHACTSAHAALSPMPYLHMLHYQPCHVMHTCTLAHLCILHICTHTHSVHTAHMHTVHSAQLHTYTLCAFCSYAHMHMFTCTFCTFCMIAHIHMAILHICISPHKYILLSITHAHSAHMHI